MNNHRLSKTEKICHAKEPSFFGISPWKDSALIHPNHQSDPFQAHQTSIDDFVSNLPQVKSFRQKKMYFIQNLNTEDCSHGKKQKNSWFGRVKTAKNAATPSSRAERKRKPKKSKGEMKKNVQLKNQKLKNSKTLEGSDSTKGQNDNKKRQSFLNSNLIYQENKVQDILCEVPQMAKKQDEVEFRDSEVLSKRRDTEFFTSQSLMKNELEECQKIRNFSRVSGKNEPSVRKIMSETKRVSSGWPQKSSRGKAIDNSNIENIPMKITKMGRKAETQIKWSTPVETKTQVKWSTPAETKKPLGISKININAFSKIMNPSQKMITIRGILL